jgi:hypothetical protein
MTTYYCHTLEEALKRAKVAGKRPGCHFGGIVLKSGKKGFAIYREGKVIEQYSVIGSLSALFKYKNLTCEGTLYYSIFP